METPFLEIPDTGSVPPAAPKENLGSSPDLFDISFILDLAENASQSSASEKYVIFKLDEETFGVSLQNVSEVCRSLSITELPNTPAWLNGIANLRGNLLAILDLQLPGGSIPQSAKSKVIVMTDVARQQTIGLLVDQILEISVLPQNEISGFSHPRNFGVRRFVSGKTEFKNNALLVFDAEQLLSSAELNNFHDHS
jgi:purine-binding chemotaxis protein CheW